MELEDYESLVKRLFESGWGVKGEFHQAWHGPITLTGMGELKFRVPATVGVGETLEYWLVIDAEGAWYDWRIRPEG